VSSGYGNVNEGRSQQQHGQI